MVGSSKTHYYINGAKVSCKFYWVLEGLLPNAWAVFIQTIDSFDQTRQHCWTIKSRINELVKFLEEPFLSLPLWNTFISVLNSDNDCHLKEELNLYVLRKFRRCNWNSSSRSGSWNKFSWTMQQHRNLQVWSSSSADHPFFAGAQTSDSQPPHSATKTILTTLSWVPLPSIALKKTSLNITKSKIVQKSLWPKKSIHLFQDAIRSSTRGHW